MKVGLLLTHVTLDDLWSFANLTFQKTINSNSLVLTAGHICQNYISMSRVNSWNLMKENLKRSISGVWHVHPVCCICVCSSSAYLTPGMILVVLDFISCQDSILPHFLLFTLLWIKNSVYEMYILGSNNKLDSDNGAIKQLNEWDWAQNQVIIPSVCQIRLWMGGRKPPHVSDSWKERVHSIYKIIVSLESTVHTVGLWGALTAQLVN